MKNTKILLAIAGISLATSLLSSCGSGDSASKTEDTTKAQAMMARPTGLDPHAISYQDAQNMIDSFKTHLRDKGHTTNDISNMDEVDFTALTNLVNDYNPITPTPSNVQRGLFISYGFENGKVVFLYQAAMKDDSSPDNPTNFGPYQIWNNASKNFQNATNATTLINAYKNTIEVKRKDGGAWTAFTANNGDTQDDNARANLMTWDELNGVYTDNSGTGNLYFYSSAKMDPASSSRDIYKHDVVVSAVNPIDNTVKQGTKGFENSADDMHNMCPSFCKF